MEFGGLFLAILLGCYICYNEIRDTRVEIRYVNDITYLRNMIKNINDRLNTLEVWAEDGPEIYAAMEGEESDLDDWDIECHIEPDEPWPNKE
jgi:hypothetical protein